MEQKITFVPLTEKCDITLSIKLKGNDECVVYPCDFEQRHALDAGFFERDDRGTTGRIFITMRPTLPGGGSSNAYYVSILNRESGKGETYKVGIINVIAHVGIRKSVAVAESYFVKCLITPHQVSKQGNKIMVQSLSSNVPLRDAFKSFSRTKLKGLTFPTSHGKLEFKYPNKPREKFTAKNLLFDFFDGVGVALTYQNHACCYEINYLLAKSKNIFVRKGEVLSDFFPVPEERSAYLFATHRAVPRGKYENVTRTGKNKYRATYSQSRWNKLFANSITDSFTLGEVPTFTTLLPTLRLDS